MKLGLNVSSNVYHDNHSVLFSGTNDYIEINGVAGDMNTEIGTMSCWVKGVAESASLTFVQATVDTNNFIRLWWKDDDKEMRVTIKRGGTASHGVDDGTDSDINDFETDGNWHHIAATWSKAANELKLYVDGTQRGSTATIGGTFSGTLDKAEIAKYPASTAYYSGSINEVSIFTTVADVSLLYNSGHPIDLTGTAGLVGYWKLDEGSGTVAADSSGKSNTGTLTNTPVWQTVVKL